MARLSKETRTCIVCKIKANKYIMHKVVKDCFDRVNVDINFKLDGRGAYVCNNPNCLEVCKKKHLLNKALKCNVDEKVYDNIK